MGSNEFTPYLSHGKHAEKMCVCGGGDKHIHTPEIKCFSKILVTIQAHSTRVFYGEGT